MEKECACLCHDVQVTHCKYCLNRFIYKEFNQYRNKKPYKCPICDGIGLVVSNDPTHGEADSYKTIPCKACDKGILWG